MKIDVEKLIREVSRHPEIYNPDHKDFANAEIRNGIFNNFISKEMNGIKGEQLIIFFSYDFDKYTLDKFKTVNVKTKKYIEMYIGGRFDHRYTH